VARKIMKMNKLLPHGHGHACRST